MLQPSSTAIPNVVILKHFLLGDGGIEQKGGVRQSGCQFALAYEMADYSKHKTK